MSDPVRNRAAVILAAGQGTRMRSPTPKVLHAVGGRAMIDWAIDTAQALGCSKIVVVVGAHSPAVAAHVEKRLGAGSTAVQDPPLGTGHAVLAAKEALRGFAGDVLVTNADEPLMGPSMLEPLFTLCAQGADMAFLGFEAKDPTPWGRLVLDGAGRLVRIVEGKDANPEEAALTACYAGKLVAPAPLLFDLLSRVGNDNAKNEYYLTEVARLGHAQGAVSKVAIAPAFSGVNSQAELAIAEGQFQAARRATLLDAGVTMTAPQTVFFSWDTQIAPGVIIEPHVVFGPGVTVDTGAVIRAFCHLEGAVVRAGALIGPYARLRPGADIGEAAHIGNFVEVKKVTIGAGAKANHLSYLGDGTVGAGANIGAGTIFCNYDGFDKHQTHIGAGAFVGSNSSLVAPVSIGAGAYTGSGSVITQDVAPDALALERGVQMEKPGWAAKFRAMKMGRKSK
jgi:bifunctional UDP-N-acetylglucosamine pyrophosphorylase/glucosamine-1-phosphate N-acetyltransferase